MKRSKLAAAMTFLVLLTTGAQSCAIYTEDYYVSPNGRTPDCDNACTSDNPCALIPTLRQAQHDGLDNNIHLKAGTYDVSFSPAEYNISTQESLTLLGEDSATTILYGGAIAIPLHIFRDSLVDDSAVSIVLKNLALTNGNRTGLYVNVREANITIENSRFLFNGAIDSEGGGADIYDFYGNVLISNSIFRNNLAAIGGGLYTYTDEGTVTVLANEFSSNHAASSSSPIKHEGGGLCIETNNGQIKIGNNIISDNRAFDGGGGLFVKASDAAAQIRITNNTIVKNSAGDKGGGIFFASYNDSIRTWISNNIAAENNATNGRDIAIDNIGDSNGSDVYMSANIYNMCEGIYMRYYAHVHRTGDLWTDPHLSEWMTLPDGRRSLRPMLGSPAIDSGDTCECLWLTTDYEGNARMHDGTVNIGAVESIVNPLPPVLMYLLN